jgi:hypothetical protein
MYFLVLGPNTEKLKGYVSQDTANIFHFAPEVCSVTSEDKAGEVEIVINQQLLLSDYHGVILNDTSTLFNYLWAQSLDIPWFSNPFKLRQAANHNYFTALAKISGFKVPFGEPTFDSGKITVNRDFPIGKEFSMFITRDYGFLQKEYPGFSKRFLRNCARFLKNMDLYFGIATFVQCKNDDFWLRNFQPTLNWNQISSHFVQHAMQKVAFTSKVISKRNR